MFAAIVWINVRHSGKGIAIEKALAFLTFITWIPILVGILGLVLGGHRLDGLEPLYWIFAVAGFAAAWWLHRKALVKQRVGLRFLRRYDRLDPVDQLWIKGITAVLFAGYLIAVVTLISHIPTAAPSPTPMGVNGNPIEVQRRE